MVWNVPKTDRRTDTKKRSGLNFDGIKTGGSMCRSRKFSLMVLANRVEALELKIYAPAEKSVVTVCDPLWGEQISKVFNLNISLFSLHDF